jgi:hypothetical protein
MGTYVPAIQDARYARILRKISFIFFLSRDNTPAAKNWYKAIPLYKYYIAPRPYRWPLQTKKNR